MKVTQRKVDSVTVQNVCFSAFSIDSFFSYSYYSCVVYL